MGAVKRSLYRQVEHQGKWTAGKGHKSLKPWLRLLVAYTAVLSRSALGILSFLGDSDFPPSVRNVCMPTILVSLRKMWDAAVKQEATA